MDINQQARCAFKLWEKLAEIESILWDLYNNEFMDLIDNSLQSSSEHEQNDPFPF